MNSTYFETQVPRHGSGRSSVGANRGWHLVAVIAAIVAIVVLARFLTSLPDPAWGESVENPAKAPMANEGVAPVTAEDQGSLAPSSNGFNLEFKRRIEMAEAAAIESGRVFNINSGWRSAESQQELLDDAVRKHGSLEAAYQWVLPSELSAHVQGLAVDVGPPNTALWLETNGWQYGLCRAYDNEPWHFEPLSEPGQPCPPREPDASVLVR